MAPRAGGGAKRAAIAPFAQPPRWYRSGGTARPRIKQGGGTESVLAGFLVVPRSRVVADRSGVSTVGDTQPLG